MYHKRCSTCKRVLSEENFHMDNKSKDGLSYSCKECKHRRRVIHYKMNPVTGWKWDKAHPEKARERRRRFRKKSQTREGKFVFH